MKHCSKSNHVVGYRCATAGAVPADCRVLKAGTGGNAMVTLVSGDSGQWVIKDFAGKHCFFRYTLGRFLIRREWSTLRRLQGLAGIPVEPIRLGPYTLSYRFVEGETLRSLQRRKARLDRDFFSALERLVSELHLRGFVHLDLRNGKNILVRPDGTPHLLDFQAGLWIGSLPMWLRRLFQAVDCSGIHKWCARLAPQHLDEERRAVLQRFNYKRRLWPFS